MNKIVRMVGFLIGTFFITNILDLFIRGLQFEPFSSKWWALFVFSAVMLSIFIGWWKHVEIKE
ncbi:MAG: hypothetical protein WCW47_02890 [Candidatus Paceibacterota bacterium]